MPAAIPRDPSPDSTLALLREGYGFIPNRCRRYGTDLFETRLMLTRAVCMSGIAAAEQFYQPGRFTRRGAMPATTFSLIQDFGSVMAIDGAGHRHRKAMFLSLLRPEALGELAEITAAHWQQAVEGWSRQGDVVLFDAAHVPLCGAICSWAGLRLSPAETAARAAEFEAMVEGTGAVGPRMLRGQLMRARTERWARGVIRAIREGRMRVPEGSAAQVIATHRDEQGGLLDLRVAAVELINILRPTVANARYMVFAAHALHEHPEWRERLRESDDDLEPFVQEVRRLYPFIPAIGGRVLEPFSWQGHGFEAGDWVLMDLYGTNRDPHGWEAPAEFRPERFRGRAIGPWQMIPSGGGDHAATHRCPGEWVTIEQMKAVTRLLVRGMRYQVPRQDLRIDLGRIPALPASRFVISEVAAD